MQAKTRVLLVQDGAKCGLLESSHSPWFIRLPPPTANSRAVDQRPPRCTLRKGKAEGPGGALAHHTEKLLSLPEGLVVSAIRFLIPWPVGLPECGSASVWNPDIVASVIFLAQHHLWSPEVQLVSEMTALYKSGLSALLFSLAVLSLVSQGPLGAQRPSRRTMQSSGVPTGN